MSNAAKQSIIILIVLLLGAFAFAGLTMFQKQGLEKNKVALEQQLTDYQQRETEQLMKYKEVSDALAAAAADKANLEKKLSKMEEVDVDEMEKKIAQLTEKRDEWKGRVEGLQKERDDLLKKLEETSQDIHAPARKSSIGALPADMLTEKEEESYWAEVLKEKSALELQVEDLKEDLTTQAVELVELKKKNSDLQLELSALTDEKSTIEREIKHGSDMADNLALELARAQNDKKFLNDRLEKMKGDNTTLREEIKKLTATKIALEKSIVRLQDEKKETERKLLETENVIQGRIEDIWEIKDSLEKTFKATKTNEGEIELPPIVVSSSQPVANPSIDPNVGQPPGVDGNIVSVNEENNFVIVDVGQNEGLRLGDILTVYRGADFVGELEVIQIRKDIAAADIKRMNDKIKVGDVVR